MDRRACIAAVAVTLAALLALPGAAAGADQARRPVFAAVAGPDAELLEVLERLELREDGTVIREHRARIAVNSYVAINRLYGETAVVFDPAHDRVEVLLNRTVLPSGEVVEAPANAVVDDLPREVHRNPLWSHLRRKVIVHTALEPGAVIERAFRVVRSGDRWLEAGVPLRLPLPVRSLEVVVDVPAETRVVWQVSGGPAVLPEDRSVDGRRTLRFRVEGLAALPDEPGAPPRDEMAPVLWVSTAPAGAAMEELSRRLDAAGALPAGAGETAGEAVRGKTSFEERVLAVLTAIRDAVSVSGEADPPLTGFRLAPLADVWRTAWAAPLELAALAAGALDSVGVDAAVGLVGAAGRDGAGVPGFAGFTRPVVVFADGEGCMRIVDPQAPLAGGPAEEVWRDRSVLTALPRPAGSTCGRGSGGWRRALTAAVTVDGEQAIAGEIGLTFAGSATPHAALVRDAGKLAGEVAAIVPGGKATAVRTPALSRRSASLVAAVQGKLEKPDAAGLTRWTLGGVPGGVDAALPPLPVAGRATPILLGGPGEETVEVTVSLAPGWTVVALPAPVAVENPVGSVRVSAEVTAGGAVRISRRITLAARVVLAASAGDVRALLAAWRSPASQEVILRLPDAAR